MSAKDVIHDNVRNALTNDKWAITDDPLTLEYEDKRVYPDLGAQRTLLGAKRNQEKIAVEVKSFLNPSIMHDLQDALGQYLVYLTFLEQTEPDRKLYIATSDATYSLFSDSAAIRKLLSVHKIPLIVVNIEREEIVEWIQS